MGLVSRVSLLLLALRRVRAENWVICLHVVDKGCVEDEAKEHNDDALDNV